MIYTPKPGLIFPLKHFGHFLLRHFGHWNISVICLTVVLKLTITVFLAYIFKLSDWNDWNEFFWSFQKHFCLWPKKNLDQNHSDIHVENNTNTKNALPSCFCLKKKLLATFLQNFSGCVILSLYISLYWSKLATCATACTACDGENIVFLVLPSISLEDKHNKTKLWNKNYPINGSCNEWIGL